MIAISIFLVILVAVHCKHRLPASEQQEPTYINVDPPPLPPPRVATQDNPAYEKIALDDCEDKLNQDQQLDLQTLSHIVTTV